MMDKINICDGCINCPDSESCDIALCRSICTYPDDVLIELSRERNADEEN